MKRVLALAIGFALSASLTATAFAAKSKTPAVQKPRQGIINQKKAVLSMQERDKKVRAVQKRASAMRQQGVNGK